MKKLIFGILAGVTLWTAGAADLNWQTDLPKALTQAKAEKKLVLLDFTGSDWCIWCKKLDADTLTQPDFATYAQTNLVLVVVDFPNSKPQAADLKAANAALGKQYSVEGFPTLVALKPDGTVAWRTDGYLEGGPKALIAKLDEAKK
jgi:thiol:disulfide interchange protein